MGLAFTGLRSRTLSSAAISGLMPVRAMPVVGSEVFVDYLGTVVGGTVRLVDQDGRRLEVVTEDGATLTFALNRATATFTVDGGQTAPRLRFADDGH